MAAGDDKRYEVIDAYISAKNTRREADKHNVQLPGYKRRLCRSRPITALCNKKVTYLCKKTVYLELTSTLNSCYVLSNQT